MTRELRLRLEESVARTLYGVLHIAVRAWVVVVGAGYAFAIGIVVLYVVLSVLDAVGLLS